MTATASASLRQDQFDVLIVGAGFAGLYQLERLRSLGFSAQILEAGGDLGGIWYWNCYPGARTDTNGPIYQYSDEDLWKSWDFDELFPSWSQMRAYFRYVDGKLDLSRDVRLNTRVKTAQFDDGSNRWIVEAEDGSTVHARYMIMCTGFGSKPYVPAIEGLERFAGECHHTAQWPQSSLDLSGQRVGVLGTGASGVQVIQESSKIASHLTVFQRTPNLALPMRQQMLDPADKRALKASFPERFAMRSSAFAGFDLDFIPRSALEVSEQERTAIYEELFAKGGFHPWLGTFQDVLGDEQANATAYAFWRATVHARVNDAATAELLAPATPPHPFGVKRPSLEQDYYESFNRPNVRLVDLKQTPIERLTERGVVTADGTTHDLDVLVLATGFDANTGGLTSIDVHGTAGQSLKDKWADGVDTHLGIATADFPNMLFVYGPQSPAAFCNGPTCAELQGEILVGLLDDMRTQGRNRFEASAEAERAWTAHVNELFEPSLFAKAESWFHGANIPGKPRQMLNYTGGVPAYLQALTEMARAGYQGFELA